MNIQKTSFNYNGYYVKFVFKGRDLQWPVEAKYYDYKGNNPVFSGQCSDESATILISLLFKT